jgi:3-deoxy-D-manno-octulosonic-acid transferase
MRMRRRGNWQAGFAERFGKFNVILKQSITNRQVLWLHAVSVGEVNLCTQLIRALEPRMPNLKMVVSTTTTTGMGELKKKLPSHVGKIYYPLDLRKYVSRALSALYPEAIILVEAEIWPNFIWRAADMGIPIFLVNARLSEKSYRRYKRFGFIFRPLFASFAGVGVQNEADAQRLIDLGCRPEVVRSVGNLKFDAAELGTHTNLNVAHMLEQVGVQKNTRILLAASTHDGEEAVLGEIFLRLRKQFPDLFLVLVPRHAERGRDVGRDLKNKGVKFIYRSDVGSRTQLKPGEVNCLVVNSTGELRLFYDHATVVFVGKSLTAQGGQTPIEPAAVGKPVVFGPNMQNFADVVREFLAKGGAVQVQNAAELEKKLAELLSDENRRAELGQKAVKVVRDNLGAIDRTVDMIIKRLDNGEIYIKR